MFAKCRIHTSTMKTRKGSKMTKSQMISEMIIAKVEAGMTVQQAYDAVFGQGAYIKMAGIIYDEIRAK